MQEVLQYKLIELFKEANGNHAVFLELTVDWLETFLLKTRADQKAELTALRDTAKQEFVDQKAQLEARKLEQETQLDAEIDKYNKITI